MSPERIRIGIPAVLTLRAETAARLQEIRRLYPGLPPVRFVTLSALGVASQRAELARAFLATDAEVLVLVGPGVVPPLGLLALADHDRDIIGAPYLVLAGGASVPHPAVYHLIREMPPRLRVVDSALARTGLVDCDAVGLGCAAIRRRVLEHPRLHVQNDGGPFAAWHDDDGIEAVSPDVMFCLRARHLGFTVAADFDLVADHRPGGVSLNRLVGWGMPRGPGRASSSPAASRSLAPAGFDRLPGSGKGTWGESDPPARDRQEDDLS